MLTPSKSLEGLTFNLVQKNIPRPTLLGGLFKVKPLFDFRFNLRHNDNILSPRNFSNALLEIWRVLISEEELAHIPKIGR